MLGSAKECTNYQTIALISQVSKEKLKILQASLQQCVNREHPDVQAGFRKGKGTRDQIANICWITEKAREFQKNFCFIDYAKAFDWVDHNKLVKFLKRWQCLSTLPASWEPFCIQVKKQQLEPDMEQWTVSKLEKEYIKAVYCHPANLNAMQCTSWEMPGWMKHKLKLRLLGEKSVISDMQMTTILMAESKEELKSLWIKVKEEIEKAGLKLNIQKTKIMASSPITSCKYLGKQWEQWQTLFWGAP